jgi:hypothetical protein
LPRPVALPGHERRKVDAEADLVQHGRTPIVQEVISPHAHIGGPYAVVVGASRQRKSDDPEAVATLGDAAHRVGLRVPRAAHVPPALGVQHGERGQGGRRQLVCLAVLNGRLKV